MAAVVSSISSPSLPRIAAPALRGALIAGMRRVITRRDLLNRINVFPVPDGDTGSNLAFTLGAVLARSLSRRARSTGDLLRAVADDAIDAARGNSGAIFAQFFHGVGEAAGRERVMTPVTLARAVRVGAEQATGALSDPREGTILSVIRAFSDALEWPRNGSVRQWFDTALQQARLALANTPNQLAVLRQAGVVDAGAQGFVDLLEGIQTFIVHGPGSEPELPVAALPAFAGEHWHGEIDCNAPWCSECLIEAGAEAPIIRDDLHAALARLGACSVVLAGGEQRLHLHAHVAEPGRLFELASQFGRISQRKADDMRMQHHSAAAASDTVAVITDSGADLPLTLQQALNIHMVSARVSLGDEEFLDKVSISPAEFYSRLHASAEMPKTSQPPPGDFRRQFEFALGYHREAVYVGLSRHVSGTLQSAETAAARSDTDGRVTVFDSGHASCGEALLAIAAGEAAQRGLGGAQIIAELERLRPLTHTFAIARDLSFGVRGGRVPRWAKPMIEGLGLTPVARMGTNGRLGIVGALWGRRHVPERFAAYVHRHLASGRWRVLVGHCGSPDDGQALLEALQRRLDWSDGWLVEAGSAIGAHAGPGALVVGVQAVDVGKVAG